MSIRSVMAHPDLPGVSAYFFDDNTVVVSDAQGRESPAQPYDEKDFAKLGWEKQDDAITQLSSVARDLLLEAMDLLL